MTKTTGISTRTSSSPLQRSQCILNEAIAIVSSNVDSDSSDDGDDCYEDDGRKGFCYDDRLSNSNDDDDGDAISLQRVQQNDQEEADDDDDNRKGSNDKDSSCSLEKQLMDMLNDLDDLEESVRSVDDNDIDERNLNELLNKLDIFQNRLESADEDELQRLQRALATEQHQQESRLSQSPQPVHNPQQQTGVILPTAPEQYDHYYEKKKSKCRPCSQRREQTKNPIFDIIQNVWGCGHNHDDEGESREEPEEEEAGGHQSMHIQKAISENEKQLKSSFLDHGDDVQRNHYHQWFHDNGNSDSLIQVLIPTFTAEEQYELYWNHLKFKHGCDWYDQRQGIQSIHIQNAMLQQEKKNTEQQQHHQERQQAKRQNHQNENHQKMPWFLKHLSSFIEVKQEEQ